jgi:L-fucose mutarotase
MLKHLPPLLTPSLLFGLAKMGHGDWLAIVDANFPAHRVARHAGAELIEMPGVSTSMVLQAVLGVFPVDTFDQPSSVSMQVVSDPSMVPAPVSEFIDLMAAHQVAAPKSLERFAFYDLAQRAQVLVQTGDMRKYANILLCKGVISVD